MSHAQNLECCRSPERSVQREIGRGNYKTTIQESLIVKVEPRNVYLKGVHILTSVGSDRTFPCSVNLLDEDGEVLAAEAGTYQASAKAKVGDLDTYGIVVGLKNPVLIWRSSSYTVKITIEGRFVFDQLYPFETDLPRCVQVSGLCFHFEGVSRHIYKLLFCKLD